MKQFLLYLDERSQHQIGGKFVLEDLDETHLLIDSNYLDILKEKIESLAEQFSYKATDLN
jgi:hypothetical protein